MKLKEKIRQMRCSHLAKPLVFVNNAPEGVYHSPYSVWQCPICGKKIGRYYTYDPENVSDGCHSFKELYHHRAVLFATICNDHPELAWKSKNNDSGEKCFGGGWFVVGIETPAGQFTYHYENSYWDMFKVKTLAQALPWDGHTSKNVKRLLSLSQSSVPHSNIPGLYIYNVNDPLSEEE